MPRAYIALGGNLGPVASNFQTALDRLDEMSGISVAQVSAAISTRAVGEAAGSDFLNAAAGLDTTLTPRELLGHLQSVEHELGRIRHVHWGARTLDLDLILFGNDIIHAPDLHVPHPACWYRRFVLDPLSEIAPDVVHPERGLTITRLRDRLRARPFRFVLAGGNSAERRQLIETLAAEFPDVVFSVWEPDGAGDIDAAVLAWLGPPSDAGQSRLTFETLPRVPRLDASRHKGNAAAFLSDVLHSAFVS